MLAAEDADLVRIHEEGDTRIAVLANGFECAFSVCWPPASRLIVDLFLQEWKGSTGPIHSRLEAAFAIARKRFAADAPGLITEAADFPDEVPSAVLLAVAQVGTTAHAAWIGGDIAILARGFGAAGATVPHTLREEYARAHPKQAADLDAVPNAVLRTIGPRAADQDPAASSRFELEPGDTLLLLSKAAFRGPGVSVEQAAFAAAAHASPAVLAERLADLAFANEDSPYAAVAVLRLDPFSVGDRIEALINEYEPDPNHGEWLGDWAREHRALPVSFDMGGVLSMRPDGSVVGVAWDDPRRSACEKTSCAAHLAALIGASRTYPALEALAPKRPEGAPSCSCCASTDSRPAAKRGCELCWYLGWRPPEPPPWFQRPLGAASSTASESRPAGSREPWWRRVFGRG
jgi:hypothetical protein